eukprot:scaffold327591_cov63-Tisochrysis_lutea.AAC.2
MAWRGRNLRAPGAGNTHMKLLVRKRDSIVVLPCSCERGGLRATPIEVAGRGRSERLQEVASRRRQQGVHAPGGRGGEAR